MSKWKMLIGGELVEAASGKTFPVINPATGEEFDRIPMGDETRSRQGGGCRPGGFPRMVAEAHPGEG